MGERVTQEIEEVLYTGNPNTRVTQEIEEVLYTGSPTARVTHAVVEVLYTDSGVVPTPSTPRFYAQIIG